MSIFTPFQQAATEIQDLIEQTYQEHITTATNIYNLIWNSVHPENIVSAMGTRAQVIFDLLTTNQSTTTMAGLKGSANAGMPLVVAANWSVEFANDGSASVKHNGILITPAIPTFNPLLAQSPPIKKANRIVSLLTTRLQNDLLAIQSMLDLMWNNLDATPQQVIGAFGANASVIFEIINTFIAGLTQGASQGGLSVNLPSSVPSDYSVTFNLDGSANVTATTTSLSPHSTEPTK